MSPEKTGIKTEPVKRLYEFGPFRIDPEKRLLRRNGEVVPLTPKVFDTLLLLVESRGQLVSKDDLINRLWPDSFVEETGLTRNISILRKALGESPHEHQYIVTVPGRGYRFVAEVTELLEKSGDPTVWELASPTIVATREESDESWVDLEFRQAASQSVLLGLMPRHKLATTLIALVLLFAVAAVALSVHRITGRDRSERKLRDPFRNLAITSPIATNNIHGGVISPDGNYLVYSILDNPTESSLWIMQLSTRSTVQLIPSAKVSYAGITISPDGNYIYYRLADLKQESTGSQIQTLHRMPLLGGASHKVLEDIDSRVSFSPDGRRMVFRRQYKERGEAGLIVADSEGANQQEVAAVKHPEDFADPAWSPDGKLIACAAGRADGSLNRYLVELSVGDWVMRPISARKWWWLGQLAWLSDGSGLIMLARDQAAPPIQVWHLAYPGGEARRITNDAMSYNRLSLSADSSKLVALRTELAISLWLVPTEDPSRAKQLGFGSGGYGSGVAWTPDGKLVCSSWAGGVSLMEGNGENRKLLQGEMVTRGHSGYPAVTPDGRYIIFSSDLSGSRHIWRMDINGSNHVQLTNGVGEHEPSCAPDGRWIIYTDESSSTPTLWKVPVEGGKPVQLTTVHSYAGVVSPDGRLIASLYSDEKPHASWRIAIFPAEGGPPVKIFPQPIANRPPVRWTVVNGPPVRWTPNGRAVTYVENIGQSSKIWLQPLDGGQPKLFREFEDRQVFGFDWSRDGKRLACEIGFWARNLVLLTDAH